MIPFESLGMIDYGDVNVVPGYIEDTFGKIEALITSLLSNDFTSFAEGTTQQGMCDPPLLGLVDPDSSLASEFQESIPREFASQSALLDSSKR